jgi:hypothetical protein
MCLHNVSLSNTLLALKGRMHWQSFFLRSEFTYLGMQHPAPYFQELAPSSPELAAARHHFRFFFLLLVLSSCSFPPSACSTPLLLFQSSLLLLQSSRCTPSSPISFFLSSFPLSVHSSLKNSAPSHPISSSPVGIAPLLQTGGLSHPISSPPVGIN